MSVSWSQSVAGGVHTKNTAKSNVQQHQKSGMQQKGLGALPSCRNPAETGSEEAMGSGIRCIQLSDYSCFRVLSLTDYNSRAKQERNTKLATHSEMDVHYRRN